MGQCWSQVSICGKSKNNGNDDTKKSKDTGHGDCRCKNVHRINSIQKWEEKLSEANKDNKIVVVNFCSSWCSPSKSIAPAYCELADKYTSLVFLSVDIDELAEFSSSWEIKSTPTFFFLKDGRQVDKLVGADKPELQKKIASFVGSK
ncbi:thioredoxin H4-1-like [Jatropha curcas]|uniref:thioredoxin H4-1-like n=1 Tax=Jatropha curcas TaxID=180498 RepID=UPI0005FBB7B3|nr:thioredoxin H4-1-like [Jatropha curcas]